MSKTDKELTTEIVCAYINYWATITDAMTLKSENVADLIKVVHKAISSLPVDN